MVLPVECSGGVKCMSFGWVNPNAGVKGAGGAEAAVLRGPVASRVASQLLLGTDWGPLDYLLLDMPPGTGDIQLTVAQHAALSGALVVTTPSALSHVDVLKGVKMFEELRVPTLAVVENLAYLPIGPKGGSGAAMKVLYPFGKPGRHIAELSAAVPSCKPEDLGLTLPVSDALTVANEAGEPLMLRHAFRRVTHAAAEAGREECSEAGAGAERVGVEGVEESGGGGTAAVAEAFLGLADAVVRRVYEEQHAATEAPLVFWDPKRSKVIVRWTERVAAAATAAEEGSSSSSGGGGGDEDGLTSAARQVFLDPAALRGADASDGSPLEEEGASAASSSASASGSHHGHNHSHGGQQQPSPLPTSIDPRGNYAVRIAWDDGHEQPFFTYDAVLAVAQRQIAMDKAAAAAAAATKA